MRDIVETIAVLILAPFRGVGFVLARIFGWATANDFEHLDGAWAEKADIGNLRTELEKVAKEVPQLRSLLDALDKELHPPPPPTLAQRLAAEHGIPCATCEAIINAIKESDQ